MKMAPWAVRSLLIMAFCCSPAVAGAGSMDFSCTGPFGRDSSHGQLVKTFGASNVISEVLEEGGGDAIISIVFPKDPKRRLTAAWRDAKERRSLFFVRIQSPAVWRAGGITPGMRLVDIERLNGRPFKLMADEEVDGFATDWQGGKLAATLPGGCGVSVRIFKISPEVLKAVHWEEGNPKEGDFSKSVSSADPALHAANPALQQLHVYFPEPEHGK